MDKGTKAACQAEQLSIVTLPEQTLTDILNHLPFKTKVACHRVSRRFRYFLGRPANNLIWGRLDITDFPQALHHAQITGFALLWNSSHSCPPKSVCLDTSVPQYLAGAHAHILRSIYMSQAYTGSATQCHLSISDGS